MEKHKEKQSCCSI